MGFHVQWQSLTDVLWTPVRDSMCLLGLLTLQRHGFLCSLAEPAMGTFSFLVLSEVHWKTHWLHHHRTMPHVRQTRCSAGWCAASHCCSLLLQPMYRGCGCVLQPPALCLLPPKALLPMPKSAAAIHKCLCHSPQTHQLCVQSRSVDCSELPSVLRMSQKAAQTREQGETKLKAGSEE
ncbi:hypothetical protein GQ54DRAFT_56796 [Martensiomyces pterosporus]|nr:hypothetical protein GQ54DRAFT_56796 [Martensiomyces pterosporus]